MFTLTIKKNGQITHGPSPFDTEYEALQHFLTHKEMGSYGKNEYSYEKEITPAVLSEPDEEGNVVVLAKAITETVNVPAEYEYFIEPLAPDQNEINQQHLKYLAETDWYVIRFLETQADIPDDVLAKRRLARESIVRN